MVPTNVQITIDSTTIHIAFNPILPGGETVEISNLNILFPAFNPESGIDPETVNRIVEQTFRSTFIGIIGIGSVALATSWLGIPGAVASLAVYSAGIIGIIAYARLLLDAGEKTKALSTLVSTCVSTALSALGAFLGAAFLEKTVLLSKQ
ncbi:MAG: hypothetical protein OEX77_09010 [Candidatus Bathyarchaeota archaeon]|nr:hypothetical protein [Candidatus Bathyarchaeota archaeon]